MDPNALPRISVVTPTFNRRTFLEHTLRSVLDQGYPNLEYIVVDGGSTDGSVDLIRSHEQRLAAWISEPDAGQYDAINKGFARSTGEVMAWINSDDLYTPWTLSVVGEIFASLPDVQWITSSNKLVADDQGRAVNGGGRWPRTCRDGFLKGENLAAGPWYSTDWIQQESTFWRRSLWEKAGGYVDASMKLAADFELWLRMFQHADIHCVPTPLALYRNHRGQKTAQYWDDYVAEARAAFDRHGCKPAGVVASSLRRAARYMPKPLRPAAARIGWVRTYRTCAFDFQAGAWTTPAVHGLRS